MSGQVAAAWTDDEKRMAKFLLCLTSKTMEVIAITMQRHHDLQPFVHYPVDPMQPVNLMRQYTKFAIMSMVTTMGALDENEIMTPRKINDTEAATIIRLDLAGYAPAQISNTLKETVQNPDFTERAVQDFLDLLARSNGSRRIDWARPQTWHDELSELFSAYYYDPHINRSRCSTLAITMAQMLKAKYPREADNIEWKYVERAIVQFSKWGLLRETVVLAGQPGADLPRRIVGQSPELRLKWLNDIDAEPVLIPDEGYLFG